MNKRKIIEKAKTSDFHLRLLNLGLNRGVPFNKPHGFKVTKIENDRVETFLPYKKRNLNHIKGLHACALATLSEFTTGLLLISKLDPEKYRIILQTLTMDYHYQGKMNAYAVFELDDTAMEREVYAPLQGQDAILMNCVVKVHDVDGNHLTTGQVKWQVKSWDKVKTKS